MDFAQLIRFKDRLAALAAKYGVKEMYVFGSIASGETTSSSDVDMLIEMEDGASVLGVGGFQYEAQELLGVEVDVVPTFALARVDDKAFAKSIRLSARPL